MPIIRKQGDVLQPVVHDAASMQALVRELGLVPFFSHVIPGFSVEEHTPVQLWFTEENLGPWDWKIDCVRSGDIAYGKFLCGGKAAFATVEVYREILNWRRSQPKYQPDEKQQRILAYLEEHGSVSVPEVRKLLGINKAAADTLLCKLQMQTRIVTGDIERVYRGADLKYSGWQRSSFCSPEALFEEMDFPFPGYKPRTLTSSLSPAQSLEYLKERIRQACGDVPEKSLLKVLA